MAVDPQQVVSGVQEIASGGWLNTLKGVVMAPFNVLAGFGKKILSWDTIVKGGFISLGLFGLRTIAPDLVGAAAGAIGGDKGREIAKGPDSVGAMALQTLGIGMGAAATINGVVGGVSGITEGFSGGTDVASRAGDWTGGIVGGVVMAGISAVAIGAVKHYIDGQGGLKPAGTPAVKPPAPAKTT
ncbi:MAG: hypothetical protein ACKVOE_09575 [Rickettsiales bacterium]